MEPVAARPSTKVGRWPQGVSRRTGRTAARRPVATGRLAQRHRRYVANVVAVDPREVLVCRAQAGVATFGRVAVGEVQPVGGKPRPPLDSTGARLSQRRVAFE